MIKRLPSVFLVALMLLLGSVPSIAGVVSGDLTKWAPVTVDFTGPTANETDQSPNPFLDYRLTVVFNGPNGEVHQVPGFFAGDGNGGSQGSVWRVRFAADQTGQWRYQATMSSGNNIAINTDTTAGTAVALDGANGEFFINAQSSEAPGFLAHGRLEYVGEHYLKFRDGPYWLKAGTDSPENFLGYVGIDGTVDQNADQFLHDFATHRSDARSDDPLFTNGSTGADSLGITGALNYLSDQGVNSIYFLPMNLGGDGQETFPFVGGTKTSFNKTHYDISKLYQWNLVLAHAQRRGIALNIQLSETEIDNERWLDNGELGVERKLFFRELIARFGYLLAAKWNLGEENDYPVSELRTHASYIAELDWTNKPIAVHTQINNFRDYEQLVGDGLFSATSIQYDPERANEFVETWRQRSTNSGRPWVIDMDENTGGLSSSNADTRRKQILYDVFFSGGNLEWYFGLHPLPLGGDTTAGDFRLREAMWTTMRHARNFIESQLPFWRMQPADNLVSGEAQSFFGGAEVFAAAGEIYAIYFPNASGNAVLDLTDASGSFSVQWFNPRSGVFAGETTNIVGSARVALGSPPSNQNDDWVVLVKSHNAPALPDFGVGDSPVVDQEPLADPETVVVPETDVDPETPVETDPAVDAEVAVDAEPSVDTDVVPESVIEMETDIATGGESDPLAEAEVDAITDSTSATADSDSEVTADSTEGSDPLQADDQPLADDQPNEPPAFQPVGELPPAVPGSLYSFSVLATDAEGVAPIITADTLPPGMTIRSVDNGVVDIDWQVPNELTQPATFELIAIDVADNNLRTTLSVTIQLDTAAPESESEPATPASIGDDLPPIILGAQDVRIGVGQTLRRTIIPVDPEGIVASLRLNTNLTGIEFLDNGSGGRDLIWTPEAKDIGVHELNFVATDSGRTPHVVSQSMTVEVVNDLTADELDLALSTGTENYAPVFVPVADRTATQGDTVNIVVRPIDPNGVAPILHVNTPPEGASFNDNGDGSRTFSWQIPNDITGNVLIQFIATDNEDLNITVDQTILIEVQP